jgi:hypothetical protein
MYDDGLAQGDCFLGWAEKSVATAPLADNAIVERSLAAGAAELCRQAAEAYQQVVDTFSLHSVSIQ